MYKQFYSVRLFFIFLLLSAGIGNSLHAQTIELDKVNSTTGGDGSIANKGDWMRYRITVTNNTSSNLTTSTVIGNIPLGGTYVAGTTKVNGVSVSDVGGKMPFAESGGMVNSPSSAAGVLAPNSSAVVEFKVAVNFSGGMLTNSSSFQAINSQGTTITLNSNTEFTQVASNSYCYYLYQSTAIVATGSQPAYNYRLIQYLDTYTGQTGGIVASYTSPTYDALTGVGIGNALADIEAMAVDPRNGRIYFVNGPTNKPAKELCYFEPYSTRAAYKYTGYPLETNTATNYTITGMSFASDGNGYALTANYQDLIRFSVDPSTNVPTITPLGALINDAANGSNSITTETGGDIFPDAIGRLYLVTSSAKLYRIDIATRNTLYLGTISGVTAGVNSAAVDKYGYLYISGAYQTVYKVDLSTMTGVAINSGTNDVWKSSDYASCNMPPLGPVLNISKSYVNTRTGDSYVLSGDPVEYTITISNTGNTSAGGVKLSDAIPAYAHYVAGSTTMNGVAVADIGGTMPFAAGSQYVNSPATGTGIVIPGDANNVVIKFRATTDPLKQVCNQAIVTYPEINSSTITVNSNDPSKPGGPDATCFYSNPGLLVNKTYRNTITRPNNAIISGDPVEYSIEVTNMGSSNVTGISLYDAIPAYAHYTPNSTTMNGASVADNSGLMPFSVTGGQLINSAAQPVGVIVPGDKAMIKFTVKTDPLKQVCNQATVTITDASGSVINYNSNDPSTPAGADATCFYSDGVLCENCCEGCSTLVNNAAVGRIITAKVQPNPFRETINLQVQSNITQQVSVRLIDLYGRTVYTSTQQLGAGYNSFHLDAPSNLAPGVYVLEMLAGNNRLIQKKLIKQ